MADITMCIAIDCPEANKCYRKQKGIANPYYQSYYNFEYECHEEMETKYEYFIPLKTEGSN